MSNFKKNVNITGLAVFAITMIVYFFSAERTGSLWDCGEFILGAYKLQVVHPPGAPLFLLAGRLFAGLADLLSDNPEHIGFAVNLLSSVCTAFAAMFTAWIAMILGKMTLVGRGEGLDKSQMIVLIGAGLSAGLATAFSTSVWFSAVEGEVYAMSTFFSMLTVWAMVKWYHLPNEARHDRWIVFAVYIAGLSMGVHLLSLLAFPALALLYYFKKYDSVSPTGILASFGVGVALVIFVQKVIITGIPSVWSKFELVMVNNMGLPFHSGVIPTAILFIAAIYFCFRVAQRRNSPLLQNFTMAFALLVISFMSMGSVMIRANASPPINMNEPSDVMRLLPYLNREQYGERALLYGPDFSAKPVEYERTPRYSRVGDEYIHTHDKLTAKYRSQDKTLFPRMSDGTQGRPALYKKWIDKERGKNTLGDNIEFFFKYQLGWMYTRYFMWNFVGRQNGAQGYYSWDPADGNWISGIPFIDEMHTHNMSELPDRMKNHAARNRYFFIPFILGLIGLLYHLREKPREFFSLLGFFIITGIGIILYTNQPPNEPRERDYVLVGSFITYCIWIGMAALAIYKFLVQKKLQGTTAAFASCAIVLLAPIVMGFQNFDDHSRMHHKASRDYASNFLHSVEENAIIFTYGDNDTYPLWYAQEVEGIRPDVRVINVSLIAVDWYINQMRRRINDSPPVKFTISNRAYMGNTRNQLYLGNQGNGNGRKMSSVQALQFMGEKHPVRMGTYEFESYLPSSNLFIPIDKNYMLSNDVFDQEDANQILDEIPVNLGKKQYLTKDEIAILDIITSNINERPVYFSVTCSPKKTLGLKDYTQLEGLALRVVPRRNPSEENMIYFYGGVATEKMYDNVVNKWRWGNLDKKQLYVNSSYRASLQAMHLTMSRLQRNLLMEGRREEAITISDKYFEGFPHMNFKYDHYTTSFIEAYINTGQTDKAKKHIRLLAEEMQDYMDFYASLSEKDLAAGFSQDYQLDLQTSQRTLQMVRNLDDEEFQGEIEALLAPYLGNNLLRG